MTGKFITFEGPEGGGKSTHAKKLAEFLRSRGIAVHLTREPGGSKICERIRALVREEMEDPPVTECEVLLFLASRAQLVSNFIRPALERGEWIVCDRFSDSTFAYQGYGRGVDIEKLRALNDFATDGLKTDLTFLLDVPSSVSKSRLHDRQIATSSSADRIELAGDGFHERLRNGFLEMAKKEPSRFVVVDSLREVEAVDAEIEKALGVFGL
jgi:dTMP kinase